MKLLLSVILLVGFSTALANFDKDYPAIKSFYKSSFLNKKNYSQGTDTPLPLLTKEYETQLLKNEKDLKYFFVCAGFARISEKLSTDKTFIEQVKKQFGTKSQLTLAQKNKASKTFMTMIYNDLPANYKKALTDPDVNESFFKQHFQKFSEVSFK